MYEVSCIWHITESEKLLFREIMHKNRISEIADGMILLEVSYDKVTIKTLDCSFCCDFKDSWHQNILYTVNYDNSPLARAINTKLNHKILDATAGFGRDTYTLAALGKTIYAIEQHPVVALVLEWACKDILNITVKNADSNNIIGLSEWDAIYFDFMFEKSNRKAKSNQGIELLAKMVETQLLSLKTWTNALESSNRVVIKRPVNCIGLPIDFDIGKPNHTIKAKTVCFDVYLGK